jgi:hypothetical protein
MWELSLLDAIEEVTEGPLLFYGGASAVNCLMFALSAEVKNVLELAGDEFRVSNEAPKTQNLGVCLCIDLPLRLVTGRHRIASPLPRRPPDSLLHFV